MKEVVINQCVCGNLVDRDLLEYMPYPFKRCCPKCKAEKTKSFETIKKTRVDEKRDFEKRARKILEHYDLGDVVGYMCLEECERIQGESDIEFLTRYCELLYIHDGIVFFDRFVK
jgi:hypothetical protein